MIPDSTPIAETLARLPLTATERAALTAALPPHARTAHDLRHVIQRGEVDLATETRKKIVKAMRG